MSAIAVTSLPAAAVASVSGASCDGDQPRPLASDGQLDTREAGGREHADSMFVVQGDSPLTGWLRGREIATPFTLGRLWPVRTPGDAPRAGSLSSCYLGIGVGARAAQHMLDGMPDPLLYVSFH